MIYLTNGFSLHMLPEMFCNQSADLRFTRIGARDARDMLRGSQFRSYFGHSNTAHYLENMWKMKIRVSRDVMEFRPGDQIILATISSKREWEMGDKPGPNFTFFLIEYK